MIIIECSASDTELVDNAEDVEVLRVEAMKDDFNDFASDEALLESEMRKSRRTTSAPMWKERQTFLLGSSCGHLILFKHNLVSNCGRPHHTPSSEVDFKVVA